MPPAAVQFWTEKAWKTENKMSQRLSIGVATISDLEALPDWYSLTDVAPSVCDALRNDTVPKLLQANTFGCLGAAIGNTFNANLEALIGLPLDRWRYARTRVVVMRLADRPIAVLSMGPPPTSFWDRMMTDTVKAWVADDRVTDPEDFPRDVHQFILATLVIDKLQLVAVSPDHRGRGHGRRLVRYAVETARQGQSALLYGQIDGSNRALHAFYSGLGFEILDPGEPLNLFMVTGGWDDYLSGSPSEAFFAKQFRG